MLFQKLVQQRRVYRIVAYGHYFPVLIASKSSGLIFSTSSANRPNCGIYRIELALIAEGHWLRGPGSLHLPRPLSRDLKSQWKQRRELHKSTATGLCTAPTLYVAREIADDCFKIAGSCIGGV